MNFKKRNNDQITKENSSFDWDIIVKTSGIQYSQASRIYAFTHPEGTLKDPESTIRQAKPERHIRT
jgi:hypothetical protein